VSDTKRPSDQATSEPLTRLITSDIVEASEDLYCASCGERIPTGTELYRGGGKDWLHDVSNGTAACGPVLRRSEH
jgi:hypothetical protein